MKNVIGTATAETVAATPTPAADQTARVCGLRSLIMELILSSPFATSLEWDTAAQRVYGCTSLETLTKWYTNTLRELADREENYKPVVYATASQREEIVSLLNHPLTTRNEKVKCLLTINRLTEEAAKSWIARHSLTLVQREGNTSYVVAA